VPDPLLHSLPTFLDLLALVTLLGVLSCHLWVLPRETDIEGRGAGFVTWTGLSRLLGWDLVLLTFTSVIVLVDRTVEMSQQPLSAALPLLPTVLFKSHYGLIWWARTGAVLALWLGWRMLVRRRRRDVSALMFCAAALVAWTYSATGHASDRGDFTLAEGMDWLHMLAVSAWGGSILAIVIAIRPSLPLESEGQRAFIADTAERLSRLAGIAVAGVLVSGVYATAMRLHSLRDLWTTQYGKILLVKLSLVLAMIVLGAVNRYFFLPRLSRPNQAPRRQSDIARRFLHRLAIQAILLVTALACVALLIHSAPPHRMTVPASTRRLDGGPWPAGDGDHQNQSALSPA
jgi:putative copper resistance protein D